MADHDPEIDMLMEQEAFVAIHRWIKICMDNGLTFEQAFTLTRNIFNSVFANIRADPGNLIVRNRNT